MSYPDYTQEDRPRALERIRIRKILVPFLSWLVPGETLSYEYEVAADHFCKRYASAVRSFWPIVREEPAEYHSIGIEIFSVDRAGNFLRQLDWLPLIIYDPELHRAQFSRDGKTAWKTVYYL